MSKTWKFNNKKFLKVLYYTGIVGFIIPFVGKALDCLAFGQCMLAGIQWITIGLFGLVALGLYLILDMKKPKTNAYEVNKLSLKWIIIIGNIYIGMIVMLILFLIVMWLLRP
jgi:L-cystine uptake protein TcyP (sodium:dicarboxylate symporter family)